MMAAMAVDTLVNPIPQQTQKRYHILNVVSKGSYGVVYRAWDSHAHNIVAIKHELYGLSESTVREITILNSLPWHPSIVELKKVVVDERGRVLVVMEFVASDLRRLIEARPFTVGQVKFMMRQILEGVRFLHDNGVMHRDLKPANILINEKDQLKICDFGLSRCVHAHAYTPGVVTQWYRAPELLLGETNYSSAIDMWSVGCIMAELLLRKVLFQGNSELQQLGCIYLTVGASLRMMLTIGGAPLLTAVGLHLLESLLDLDPSKRITAKDALNHVWFQEF